MAIQTLVINADIFHVNEKTILSKHHTHTPRFLLTQLLKGLDICDGLDWTSVMCVKCCHHKALTLSTTEALFGRGGKGVLHKGMLQQLGG